MPRLLLLGCCLLVALPAAAQRGRRGPSPDERREALAAMRSAVDDLQAAYADAPDEFSSRDEWRAMPDDERERLWRQFSERRDAERAALDRLAAQVATLRGTRAAEREHEELDERLAAIQRVADGADADAVAACLAALRRQRDVAFYEQMKSLGLEDRFDAPEPRLATGDRFVPGALWPDDGVHINAHGGGLLYHDGAYYWFGEHKVGGPRGNSAQVGVGCYRSTDLYHWTNEGVALAVSDDPDSDITRGSVIERPKVIHNASTGEFVMWFHLELKGQGYNAARTGVAVADRPTGPYRFLRSLRPNAGVWPENYPERLREGDSEEADTVAGGRFLRRDYEGGQMARDMTLFVDDDGRAYHVHAAEENYTLHLSELTDDYRGFTGRYIRVFPGGHNEAPALFKRGGKYYLLTSGCTGWAPNAARSAEADSIWGPWRELGNPCVGLNPQTVMGPELTFGGQSTHVQPVIGKDDAYVAMFDQWRPDNPIDGRYLWLPVEFPKEGGFRVRWRDEWELAELGD